MHRVERSWTTLLLAVGDLACIAAFVLAGEFRHYDRATALARAPETALPFVVGWAVVGTLAGVYARSGRASAVDAAGRTAAGWLGAVVIGQSLRATPYLHGDFTPAFALVSLLVGGGLLVGWRLVATRFVA